jgi:N-acetylglutamate synthase/N-acetylornithine aminotransferase
MLDEFTTVGGVADGTGTLEPACATEQGVVVTEAQQIGRTDPVAP